MKSFFKFVSLKVISSPVNNYLPVEVVDNGINRSESVPIRNFCFKPEFVDNNGNPKIGLRLRGIINEKDCLYLDKRDKTYYVYDASKDINRTIFSGFSDEIDFPNMIYRLLCLRRIGGLTEEVTEHLLILFTSHRYEEFKSILIDSTQMYNYLFEPESSLLERKSSLIHPAHTLSTDPTEIRNQQLDEISMQIVAAGNARQLKDFHLVIGIDDDGKLNDNVKNEIAEVWKSNKKFIDIFTNRLCQLINIKDFVSTLNFQFVTAKGHLLLDVTIPQWKGDILFFKQKVYTRVQAQCRLIEGEDLMNYFKQFMSYNKNYLS